MQFYHKSFGMLSVNCYFCVDDDGNCLLIDAPSHADEILQEAERLGVNIRTIVLTHGHFDHITALPELKQKTGATVMIHRNGKDFLQDSDYNLCRHFHKEWTPMEADRYLEDGDEIAFGAGRLLVLHTPGHTSDSISLVTDGVVFSGDTLFDHSLGRSDFPTGDFTQEIQSIREKLFALPDDTIVCPGHGAQTRIGIERKENPYLS